MSEEGFSDIIAIDNKLSDSESEQETYWLSQLDSDSSSYRAIMKDNQIDLQMKPRIFHELPVYKLKMKMRRKFKRKKYEDKDQGFMRPRTNMQKHARISRSPSPVKLLKSKVPKLKEETMIDPLGVEDVIDIPYQHLKEVERLFTCGICSNRLHNPIFLNWAHRFCKDCIIPQASDQ